MVFSLPDADDPVIWQMDLDAYKACAFEIKTKAKKHILVMKDADGKASDIAKFSDKALAVDALMRINAALNETPAEKPKTPKKTANKKRIGIILGLIALIFVLIFSWASMLRTPYVVNDARIPTNAAAQTPASQSSGVPVSADDFLAGQ